MLAEEFTFHDLGKAQDGVERGAELVAHRGEEAALGEARLLGPAARLVGVQLRLFELDDQFVLLGLEQQGRERRRVQAPRQNDEIDLRDGRHGEHRQELMPRLGPGEGRDGEHHRDQARIDGGRHGGRDHRRHRADEQQHEQHRGLGRRVVNLHDERGARGPNGALHRLGGDQDPLPRGEPGVAVDPFQKQPGGARDQDDGGDGEQQPGHDEGTRHPERQHAGGRQG